MTDEKAYMSLPDYLGLIRAHRLLMFLVPTVCAALALAYSLAQTPTYSASAALQVQDLSQDLALLGTAVTQTPPAVLAAEHVDSVLRPSVVDAAAIALHMRPAQVRNAVEVAVEAQTSFVDVTASATDASRAARIANEVASVDATQSTRQQRAQLAVEAQAFASRSKSLRGSASNPAAQSLYDQRLSNLVGLSTVATPVAVRLFAQVPSSPSSPKTARNVAVGVFVGIILALLLIFFRHAVDVTLKDVQEASDTMEAPNLAYIHVDTLGTGRNGESNGTKFDPLDIDAFRMLRQGVDYLGGATRESILVTSSAASEGKSTVALGLAMVNAGAGRRTVLVECDLRRPVLALRLSTLLPRPGLAQYVVGDADVGEIEQRLPVTTGLASQVLTCVVAGDATADASDLLSAETFGRLLGHLRERYEVVIIDSAPILAVSDALSLIPHCDRVLMCARMHQTTRQQLEASRAVLRRATERPIGVVVTGIRDRDARYYAPYEYAPDRLPAYSNGDTASSKVSASPSDAG